MNDENHSRRRVVGAGTRAIVAAGVAPWIHQRAWGQASGKKPLRIGVTTDETGAFAASGQDERRGIEMALAEANAQGGVLGRRIEILHADTGGNPEQAATVAHQMISQQEAGFLIGAVHSGVASAISTVAQKSGCIYFNTNSSSPTESGKDCHRVKFVWDGNGANFSATVVKGAMEGYGKDWALITSDYSWGKTTAKGIRALVQSNGGRIVEELLVAQNTRNFAATLESIRRLKPQVVATAVGGDDLKALRERVFLPSQHPIGQWLNLCLLPFPLQFALKGT